MSDKSKMIEGLNAISERNRIALAYLELAKDKVFKKMSEEEQLGLIKEVLVIGDDTARQIVEEYGIRDPRKIAVKLGIRVFGEEKAGQPRSEYRREKKEIVVSRRFHEKLLREVESAELSEHLLKFFVAHELFHYLEWERIGEVYRRYKFKSWRLGPYIRESFIKGLSEVAAQAFTQTLLGLEISPQVFDYLTYILYTKKS